MKADNKHKVIARKWNKWSPQAQAVFNEVYGTMLTNQDLFHYPKQGKFAAEHWKTMAWNAAWTAANAAIAPL